MIARARMLHAEARGAFEAIANLAPQTDATREQIAEWNAAFEAYIDEEWSALCRAQRAALDAVDARADAPTPPVDPDAEAWLRRQLGTLDA